MAREITVPELGENIESATVAGILVSPGDSVSVDQALIEVEAGKATVEIPSDIEGTIDQILVEEGDTVDVGQAIATVKEGSGTDGETTDTGDEEETPREKQPEQKDDAEKQQADEEDGQKKQTGTQQADSGEDRGRTESKPQKESRGEQDTDSRPQSGQPKRVPVILPGEDAQVEPADAAEATTMPVSPARHVPAAPSVRRFAREIGVNVDAVRGSGPHGRVATPPLPDFEKWGNVRREKMSGIRYATAKQISLCWSIPRVTHFDQADITELEALRKRYADRASKQGGKLTMAVMVTKVVASALRKFPRFNASVDMSTKEVVFKNYVNVGIAVATERGLMVPVLRDADKKNMVQLAAEIDAVARKCREGKITPEELEGGTFTVTNLGSIGGSYFTPIINYPEVAILGLGRAGLTPVVRDGNIETGLILPLSLSYDHRLIDGADAARFVRWIAEAIEEPLILSLEGE
jgi:pyruvate dehydrogenase E2 component (dihydrolipoamide acetyltransferase)